MGRKRKINRRGHDPVGDGTKFTRGRQKLFYEGLRAKLPVQRICELAGISSGTYRLWMRKGLDGQDQFYVRFRNKVKKIIAEREAEALEIIRIAAKGGEPIVERKISKGPKGVEVTRIFKRAQPQWQAAAKFLELTARDIYGPSSAGVGDEEPPRPEIEFNLNHNISGQVDLSMLSEQQLTILLDIQEKIGPSVIPAQRLLSA